MSLFIWRTKRMKHVRGLFRAAGYLSVTALAFSAYSIKVARAEMQQSSILLGREMLQMMQTTSHHSTTPMVLNGQKMYVGSSVSDDEPAAILDRYEASCKADPGQPAAGWRDLAKGKEGELARAGKEAELGATGLFRAGTEREGTVLCFVRGENTKATAQEAFDSFMQTGELGALGRVRYVYAKKSRENHTLVLTAWTESKFNLAEMLPGEGRDAPGEDFPEIPRVPNAFRALSSHAEGLPYGVNVYKTTDAPATTLAFYDKRMTDAGWRAFDPELDDDHDGRQGARSYLKDGMVLTVGARVQPEGNFVALGLAGVAQDDSAPSARR